MLLRRDKSFKNYEARVPDACLHSTFRCSIWALCKPNLQLHLCESTYENGKRFRSSHVHSKISTGFCRTVSSKLCWRVVAHTGKSNYWLTTRRWYRLSAESDCPCLRIVFSFLIKKCIKSAKYIYNNVTNHFQPHFRGGEQQGSYHLDRWLHLSSEWFYVRFRFCFNYNHIRNTQTNKQTNQYIERLAITLLH